MFVIIILNFGVLIAVILNPRVGTVNYLLRQVRGVNTEVDLLQILLPVGRAEAALGAEQLGAAGLSEERREAARGRADRVGHAVAGEQEARRQIFLLL